MRALVATHHVAAALRTEAHVVAARGLLLAALLALACLGALAPGGTLHLLAPGHVAVALRAEAHVVAALRSLLSPLRALRGLLAPLGHLLAGHLLVALVKLLHNTGNLLNGLPALLRGHLLPGLHERVVGPLGVLLGPLLTLRSLLSLLGTLRSLLAPGGTLRALLVPLRALRGLLAPGGTLRSLLSLLGALRGLGSPLRALAGALALPLVALPGLAHVVAVAVLLDGLGSLHGSGRLRSLGSTLRLLGKHGKSGQNRDK